MKILHLCYSDNEGGAALAAYSIHRLLLEHGFESSLLVFNKTLFEKEIIQVPFLIRFKQKLFYKMSRFLFRKTNGDYSTAFWSTGILDYASGLGYDILHIHWLGGESVGYRELANVKKNIVWTLHDLWPINGIFHYNLKSNSIYSSFLKWWDERFSAYKRQAFFKNKVHFIAPSPKVTRYLPVILQEQVKVIPNYVDKNISQGGKNFFEKEEGLFYVGFGASINDSRKGFQRLLRSILFLPKETQNKIVLVLFGDSKPKNIKTNVSYIDLGFIKNRSDLFSALQSIDIMSVPSDQETFGLLVLEALICGTPSLGFEDSGLENIINHKENGYLAKYLDEVDYKDGLLYLLENRVGESKISEKFGTKSILENLISVYEKILE